MVQMVEKGIKLLHSSFQFTEEEIRILRDLAEKVAEHAASDAMKQKADLWRRHNDLETDEPVVFISPENGWNEIIKKEELKCTEPLARNWERNLKMQIFWAEKLLDDKVIEPYFNVPYSYWDTGWGLDISHIGVGKGKAYALRTAIEEYEEDFEKVHHPKIIIDWEESRKILELAQMVFGGILTVRRHMSWWWSLGLSSDFIRLRGLENFMCDLILEPEWVERLFGLICQGKLDMIDYLEANHLLYQNVEGNYVGSGGFGYTGQIATKKEGEPVTTADLWGFCESQATVSVSPEMYGEFIFPHHKRILERFGMNCYGCCEAYDPNWKYIKQFPRLRRVSVSPWADWKSVPQLLGKDYIASVKPTPTPLSRPVLDEAEVREYCRRAVCETKGGICEFIMKDTHTFGNNPHNAVRWVEIMREEIQKVYG